MKRLIIRMAIAVFAIAGGAVAQWQSCGQGCEHATSEWDGRGFIYRDGLLLFNIVDSKLRYGMSGGTITDRNGNRIAT